MKQIFRFKKPQKQENRTPNGSLIKIYASPGVLYSSIDICTQDVLIFISEVHNLVYDLKKLGPRIANLRESKIAVVLNDKSCSIRVTKTEERFIIKPSSTMSKDFFNKFYRCFCDIHSKVVFNINFKCPGYIFNKIVCWSKFSFLTSLEFSPYQEFKKRNIFFKNLRHLTNLKNVSFKIGDWPSSSPSVEEYYVDLEMTVIGQDIEEVDTWLQIQGFCFSQNVAFRFKYLDVIYLKEWRYWLSRFKTLKINGFMIAHNSQGHDCFALEKYFDIYLDYVKF